ncbi:MAG TPA: methylglyoxal synthase, partial [Promineifilum sp.]|nr:methylglyoxal synthase [Promineifilum sp.]
MTTTTDRPRIVMGERKRIALVAHDNKKDDLLEWAAHNLSILREATLFATGTTGRILSERLGLPVARMESGPLGGDMELGAEIVRGAIDVLIFFFDPLEAQPHDPDIRALLRIAAV